MSKPYRVIISGNTEWTSRKSVLETMKAVELMAGPIDNIIIIQGESRGAERIARGFAYKNPLMTVEAYPANWGNRYNDTYRPAAGKARNQQMVDSGADLCVGFFVKGYENTGVIDCLDRAKLAGIKVLEIWNE
jgi:hypothetical protein